MGVVSFVYFFLASVLRPLDIRLFFTLFILCIFTLLLHHFFLSNSLPFYLFKRCFLLVFSVQFFFPSSSSSSLPCCLFTFLFLLFILLPLFTILSLVSYFSPFIHLIKCFFRCISHFAYLNFVFILVFVFLFVSFFFSLSLSVLLTILPRFYSLRLPLPRPLPYLPSLGCHLRLSLLLPLHHFFLLLLLPLLILLLLLLS